jgi:hypothetical protein
MVLLTVFETLSRPRKAYFWVVTETKRTKAVPRSAKKYHKAQRPKRYQKRSMTRSARCVQPIVRPMGVGNLLV